MVDISMAGASITIANKGSGNTGLNVGPITQFSDESNPIEISDIQVADGNMNMNGELVTWTKPSPARISFTLIPGTKDDNELRAFLRAVSIGGKNGKLAKKAYIGSLILEVPIGITNSGETGGSTNQKTMKKYSFKNGRLINGSPGIGSNAEGKATPSTYEFMFEGCTEE